jgi:peptidyl-prolyl cis-trans isomerase C
MKSDDERVDGQVDVDTGETAPSTNGAAPSHGVVTRNGTEASEPSVEAKPDVADEVKPEAESEAGAEEEPVEAVADEKAAVEDAAVEDAAVEDAAVEDKGVDEKTVAMAAVAGPEAKSDDKGVDEETVAMAAVAGPEAKPDDKGVGEETVAMAAVAGPEAKPDDKPDDKSDDKARSVDLPPVPPADVPAKSGGFALPEGTRARVLSVVALVVVICLGVGGYLWYHATHVASDVAFRAYGQDVLISELNDEVQTDQALYGFVAPTDGPKLDQFRKDFAKAAAVSRVVDNAAAARNIVVADREASDTLARYITQVYGPGDEGHTKFVAELANKATSEPKVLAELKRQITLTQLTQQVTSGIQVSDQDVQQYFDTHQAQLGTPELRDLHNLVVATQAQGEQVVAQLKAGANFEQLAQKDSLDDSTKLQGGELGAVSAQQLEPAYSAAAFATPVNGIFGPVQGAHGFNVGRVVAITPPGSAVFAQIKDQLREQLIGQRAADKWRQFLGEQIKDAHVVYNPVYRPADPDALPSVGGAAAPAAAPGQPAAQVPPK